MITPQQTAADLRSAADNVRRHGWTQGLWKDERGRLCALGAMGTVISSDLKITITRDPRFISMINAFTPLLPESPDDETLLLFGASDDVMNRSRVTDFNDKICTGGEELAVLFEQAAEKVEADIP